MSHNSRKHFIISLLVHLLFATFSFAIVWGLITNRIDTIQLVCSNLFLLVNWFLLSIVLSTRPSFQPYFQPVVQAIRFDLNGWLKIIIKRNNKDDPGNGESN